MGILLCLKNADSKSIVLPLAKPPFSRQVLELTKKGDTMRTTRRGFTLVELLIVLAVIAALMGVATPASINAVQQAKASQVAQNFRNLKAALVTYFYTERPADPTEATWTDIVPNHLSAIPKNFDFSVTSSSGGKYTMTLTYNADDVDKQAVKDVLDEVNISGTYPTLQTTVQK